MALPGGGFELEPVFKPQCVSVAWDMHERVLVGTRAGELRELWIDNDGHTVDPNNGPIIHGQWQWTWPKRCATSRATEHRHALQVCLAIDVRYVI